MVDHKTRQQVYNLIFVQFFGRYTKSLSHMQYWANLSNIFHIFMAALYIHISDQYIAHAMGFEITPEVILLFFQICQPFVALLIHCFLFFQVLKSSPSSSEDALTSMRSSQTNLRRQYSKQPGLPTMDRFLSHLGDPGRYQVIIMVLLAANCIPVVVNHLLMAFYAVRTPHNCRVSLFDLSIIRAVI